MTSDAECSVVVQLAAAVERATRLDAGQVKAFAIVYVAGDDRVGVLSAGIEPGAVVQVMASGIIHFCEHPSPDISYELPG